jgi:anti-sigma factor RsiW
MTDDEELIALIDNELDDEARASLTGRLAEGGALRDRYDALRRSRDALASAFETLLGQAPVERLRATLPPAAAASPARRARFGWMELAAAFVVGAIVAGAAIWIAFGRGEGESAEDWRAAVIEYAELYTPATFAFPSPDDALARKQLQAVGEKIGLDLTPQNIDVQGLAYKIAINFAFANKPLAEIAYTNEKGEPVLFCITANGAEDAKPRAEMRGGFSTASWSHGGRSYMVVAQQPEDQVAELAQTFAARF